MRCKHPYIFFIQQMRHAIWCCTIVKKPSLFHSFFNPCVVITVPVENNTFMILDGLANHFMQYIFKIFRIFQSVRIDFQTFRHRAVQHDIRAGNAVGGTKHAEFKFISGKCKGRCTIAVCSIAVKLWKYVHAQLHLCFFSSRIGSILFNRFEYGIQFFSKENRNNCRRCFVCPKSVIVSCCRYRKTEQILIIVHSLNNRTKE